MKTKISTTPLYKIFGYNSQEELDAEIAKHEWVPELIPGPFYQPNYGYKQYSKKKVDKALQLIPKLEFHDAWHFLHNHPCVFDLNGQDRFEQIIDVWVVKINPETDKYDDDKTKNTKTQVWLEFGSWLEQEESEFEPAYDGPTHDIRLDCGADTYEEAIVLLAQLVSLYYGTWKEKE